MRYVEHGGSKTSAARVFGVSRMSVHRHLNASKRGDLKPKVQGGSKKKFDSESLRREVKLRPDATLVELGKALGVSRSAVWKRLRQLAITLKKTHALRGARRPAKMAFQQGVVAAPGGSPRVFSR